jgi:CheY-like chemotaxis protein
MQIPSILLVEDDEVDVEVVRRAFCQHKIANPFIHAMDGVCALEILRGESDVGPLRHPYIILLDIKMPRMDGLQFLKELRQDPVLQRSVVFILTTSDDPQDREEAYSKNVAGYILKQNIGTDFADALRLLDAFQTVVILPDAPP